MAKREYVINTPIVFERGGADEKDEDKISVTVLDWEESEAHLLKAMDRTVQATNKSLRTYRKARKKSLKQSEDGAIVDFVPNVAEGTAVFLQYITLVPLDVMRAAYTPPVRKLVRRSVRAMTRNM